MFAFLYTFINFFQPGVLWPELASLRPMLIMSFLAGTAAVLARPGAFTLAQALKRPAVVAMGFFVAAQVASLYYGGIGSMLEALDFWHVYALFVIISLLLLTSVEGLGHYVWGMIAGTMIVVVYGIYAVFAKLPAAVGGRAGAFGMYENHNDYSFIIIMSLPFIFMMRKHENRFFLRLFLGLSLLACILGIFLSLSRGGIIALVLELVLIVMATYTGRKRFWHIVIMIAIGMGAIGFQFAKRAANQGNNYTEEDAESSRIELWKAGMHMVEDRPFLGVGSRHFAEFSREYGELSGDQIGKNSHNTYIEVISTSGIIGFLAFVSMLRGVIREVRQKIDIPGYEWLDSMRSATLISIWSIILRGLLDAKPHDWSFYVLCSIAVAYGFLRRSIEREQYESADEDGSGGQASPPPGVVSPEF